MAKADHVGRTRSSVLREIRSASTPLDVLTIASRLGLHANTVRFHTSGLHREGLLDRGLVGTGGKGRPRVVFSATTAGQQAGPRNYRALSAVLLQHIAESSADPPEAAREAGRAWGAQARTNRPVLRTASNSQVTQEVLTELRFAPHPQPARAPREFVLHNCPFREEVEQYKSIVCQLHLGILEGTSTGPLTLTPFVTPTTCVVTLER